jgi:glycosyltransferase involved in cell wall biosynthesis
MISVVMPAYNSERFIGAAIGSILHQTFKTFEFNIVDDGSTDRTAEIIDSYVKEDPRLNVIRADHRGVSNAINLGVEHAKYNWIAIMHADDIALPQRLERQIRASRVNSDVVAWGAYAFQINERSKVLGLSKVGATTVEEFYKKYRRGETIQLIHPTALICKRALLKMGGYNTMFHSCEDLELFNRLSLLGPILAIPEALILYRIHRSSNTMQRFFEMRAFARFIRSCQRARAEGQEPPTWHRFKEEYEGTPMFKKARRQIDDLSQFYYRKFAVEVSSERYLQATIFFCLSIVLNPRYALPRVWNQRFSKLARSSLKATKTRIGRSAISND